MNWHHFASQVRWNIQPFIDGRYRPSSATELVDNLNPATELSLGRFAAGDTHDVDEAVRVARRRFEEGGWSELPPRRRGDVLMKLADLLVQHRSELALLDTLEVGKPICAALDEVEHFTAPRLRSWAGFADKLLGSCAPLSAGTLLIN